MIEGQYQVLETGDLLVISDINMYLSMIETYATGSIFLLSGPWNVAFRTKGSTTRTFHGLVSIYDIKFKI